jgi:hypothetical protein
VIVLAVQYHVREARASSALFLSVIGSIFTIVLHRALPDLQRMKLANLRPRRRHRGRYSLGAIKPVQ